MDVLFFRKIFRSAFIVLYTKAFSLFVFNNVLECFEHDSMYVYFSQLLDYIILMSMRSDRVLRESHFESVETCEITFYYLFTNSNCKRDKVDNVATRKLIEVIGNDVQKYERWKVELLNEFYTGRAQHKTRKVLANLTSPRIHTHLNRASCASAKNSSRILLANAEQPENCFFFFYYLHCWEFPSEPEETLEIND